jgi:hypothetical protein
MKAALANVRNTLARRNAKAPEGVTEKPQGMTTRNKKIQEEKEKEKEDSDDEADELKGSSDGEEDVEIRKMPVKTIVGPLSAQKRVQFEELPLGGLPTMVAKPTRSGMVPFVDIPRMNPALKTRKPVETVDDEPEPIPVIEKKGPAYKHRAPVEEEADWVGLIKNLKGQPITLSQGQLLGLISSQNRKKVIEELSAKRIPVEKDLPKRKVTMVEEAEGLVNANGDSYEYVEFEELPEPTYTVLMQDEGGMKAGAIIANDPILQYLNGLAPEEAARKIVVARESYLLKALYPVVNAAKEIESIIDGGSQIVSMSSAIAVQVGAQWDPDITINMQSANSQLETTQGLVKNMPFRFGDEITVYFQVHVIKNAAYDVLLGRPFEVLTASVFENSLDGSQMVTLTEPNTGRRCKMPTYDRGRPRQVLTREGPPVEDSFRTSMS